MPSQKFEKQAHVRTKRNFFAVPLRYVKFDPQEDFRDRTTEAYKQHFAQIKEAIVARQGIEGALQTQRGKGEESDYVWLTNGRTRLLAAREAIAEGLLPVTEDELLVTIEIRQGGKLEAIGNQLKEQNVLGFGSLEWANAIAAMVRTAGGEHGPVAKEMGCTVQQVQKWLKIDQLNPQIKKMVSQGDVAASTAIEVAEALPEPQAVEKLQKAAEIKKEKVKQSGEKKKSTKVSKNDLRRADIMDQPNWREQMAHQIDEIKTALDGDGLDPVLVEQLHKLAQKLITA